MPTTFRVSDVRASNERLRQGTLVESLQEILNSTSVPEATGANASTFVEVGCNPFVQAVHHAFDKHLPLVLSPDDVWLAIAQGFAKHVNVNAETLRKRFVAHEGKAIIRVTRDDFIKGAPDNDWQGAFTEFSEQIGNHIGKKRDLLVSDFSTTAVVEHAASDIVLMDAMQQFFDYRLRTRCGIPNITLLGTIGDWKDIRTRAAALGEYECSWWIDKLVPVLDEFVAAADGRAKAAFWQSFYKEESGSGGPYVTGTINTFFPYVGENNKQNSVLTNPRGSLRGPNPEDMPHGLACAPFIWEYLGTNIKMELLGGFVGVSQDESGAVRPAIGWAVREPDTSGRTLY